MLRDFERGDMVQYGPSMDEWLNNEAPPDIAGLVVNVEYNVKSDDFLIFIMWPDAGRPQALFQKDCHNRGLKVLD